VDAKVKTSESEVRVSELQRIVDARCPVYSTMVAADVEMIPNWKTISNLFDVRSIH
jgi:putative redox protein